MAELAVRGYHSS